MATALAAAGRRLVGSTSSGGGGGVGQRIALGLRRRPSSMPSGGGAARSLASTGGAARPPHPSLEVSPEVKKRNRLVALACVAFAFSVYSYSIRKLKEEDLSELEDVTVVNLHESGLKATKFKGLLEESQRRSAEEEEEEAERQREAGLDPSVAMVAGGEGGKKGGKGWGKYLTFWRKE